MSDKEIENIIKLAIVKQGIKNMAKQMSKAAEVMTEISRHNPLLFLICIGHSLRDS